MTSKSERCPTKKVRPGHVRDTLTLSEIEERVLRIVGHEVSPSSIRSSLNLNVGALVERVGRGRYGLSARMDSIQAPVFEHGGARLFHEDCLTWLSRQPENSIHAVVTDPPYGANEYSAEEQAKLRTGSGGVWRIPPTLDGVRRAPVPRFTTLTPADYAAMSEFFTDVARALAKVLVPGANVLVAANPLLSHLVSSALSDGGLERRGEIIRLVQTLRGGDRPKGAHDEFPDVTVMPRAQWEPWLLYRKPLVGTVAKNLRTWGTGGFRRISDEKPFGDVIKAPPAPKAERAIAAHPSLKPQSFLRQVVRASLPLASGVVLDPFAGSGSTLAAAEAVGYQSVGVERDPEYVDVAKSAIPQLARLKVKIEEAQV
jgi:site-specific DNA-methyltransferase (adenine-specific)